MGTEQFEIQKKNGLERLLQDPKTTDTVYAENTRARDRRKCLLKLSLCNCANI